MELTEVMMAENPTNPAQMLVDGHIQMTYNPKQTNAWKNLIEAKV